jgi:1-acyl-sn-glycerol-3-phosphate acyltransferase
MHKDQGVIIFPEGTSSSGSKVLPLRSSLLHYPSSHSIEVHAASLHYRTGKDDTPAIDSVCFFGGRHSFMEHFLLMAENNQIFCTLNFAPTPIVEEDRKLLTRKLQHKIEEVFTPSSTPELQSKASLKED